jgi:ferric-dicitrate binding protein FerR (iron transport regulator)
MSRTDDMEVSVMPTPRTRGKVSRSHRIGLVALVFAIGTSAALAGSTRRERELERIFVTAVSGTVSVTIAGSSTPVQLDSTVGLPARIVTGDDGMLSLTQAGTNITIAADSDVEIPAEASDGQLIARLVQRRGNVFYDVAHREVGTLRVETPFLVAVIKGTQFNVAVQDASSTISLFQGRLDIRTPDGSDSVLINAGQIATRGNTGNAISVIGMNDVRLQAPRTGDAVARSGPGSDDAIQPRVFAVAAGARDTPADAPQARLESASSAVDVGRPGSGVGLDLGSAASVGRSLHVGTGDPGAGAGPGAGGAPASLGVTTGVRAGGVPASLGLSPGLGAGGAPASIGANLNVGANAGAGTPGVSLGAGAGLGAGGTPAIGANVNVGSGSPGVSLGTGVGVGVSLGGSVTVDIGHDDNGLHLGNGGSIGDNLGLHLGNGNGNGNLAPPGKSHGHP